MNVHCAYYLEDLNQPEALSKMKLFGEDKLGKAIIHRHDGFFFFFHGTLRVLCLYEVYMKNDDVVKYSVEACCSNYLQ